MSKSKKKKGGKNLTARDLQIQTLRFLLAHPKKRYSARQIIEHLHLENSKDSVGHALGQLAQAGSVLAFEENKFGVALDRLTTDFLFEEPENQAVGKSQKVVGEDANNGRKSQRVVDEDDNHDRKSLAGMPTTAKFETAQPREAENPKRQTRTSTREPRVSNPEPPVPEIVAKRTARATQPTFNASKTYEGRVDMTRTGAAYIVTDQLDSDIYVAGKNLNGAMNGDTVSVMVFPKRPSRRRNEPERKPEGEVLSILKRAHEIFMGTIRFGRKYALFVPDNSLITRDIFVEFDHTGGAKDGDKVVLKVTDWQDNTRRAPIGKVTQVLGKVAGHDFEMNKILINQGFELAHSEEAEAESNKIPLDISPQEIARRRDFRDVLTFTIDPEDAKDFDDALSIKQLDDGKLEIGIHIADVTHYLKPGTPLDQEAFKRSTSVYLVDRVSPMLPERLSNNLCSLVPHQDRLTFSAVFVFSDKDKLESEWFGKTVIHSAKRFSYEEAQTVLDGKPAESVSSLEIFPQLEWGLKNLDRISKKMRKEREKNGAIGFETEEVRFRLELDGTPIEAFVKDRKEAHLLIEDFMLLANREVAMFMDKKGAAQQEVPFVYRVHDLPDMEKVKEFARFAAEMGHKMDINTPKLIAKSYNELMLATKTNDRLKLLEPLAIRTMAKAVYTTKNIGHYGLGFDFYTHFTSPIRRYSDVLVHRILNDNLEGRTVRMDKSKLEELCKHVSQQEKKAADAERESVKYKQAELTARQIGQTMTGVISGIIERGFFVELPGSKAEGMVAFRDLDDTYVMVEGKLSARGQRWGRVFKMGDRVDVRVAEVDLMKRQIELELVK